MKLVLKTCLLPSTLLVGFLFSTPFIASTPAQDGIARADLDETVTLGAGEIRLNGVVRALNAATGRVILEVTSFAVPSGKTQKLPSGKLKAVVTAAQVPLPPLKLGDVVSAIGPDSGSGQTLTARFLTVTQSGKLLPPLPRRVVLTKTPSYHYIDIAANRKALRLATRGRKPREVEDWLAIGATALNNNGVVVGTMSGFPHNVTYTFKWTAKTGKQRLSMSAQAQKAHPLAINEAGWIVGYCDRDACAWTPQGKFVRIGRWPSWWNAYAVTISPDGTVLGTTWKRVGPVNKSTPYDKIFIWRPGGHTIA